MLSESLLEDSILDVDDLSKVAKASLNVFMDSGVNDVALHWGEGHLWISILFVSVLAFRYWP